MENDPRFLMHKNRKQLWTYIQCVLTVSTLIRFNEQKFILSYFVLPCTKKVSVNSRVFSWGTPKQTGVWSIECVKKIWDRWICQDWKREDNKLIGSDIYQIQQEEGRKQTKVTRREISTEYKKTFFTVRG